MAEEMEIEERMIDCKCPYCGESVSFTAMNAGTAQECPFCMAALIVPKESCEIGGRFPLPIETPRLILRRLTHGDADALAQLVSDKELLVYLSLPAKNEEDVADWLDADAKVDLSRLNPELFLAIQLQENEKLLGLVSIRYGNGDYRVPEVTVVIGRSEQRKGYGTEALRGVLGFGFRGLNLRRITAHCDSRNAAFIALAAKAGLRQEGAAFEDRYFEEKWVDTAYFAMLQSEYEGAAPPSA
jgi:RimJ/RimL family protein N-acetyltransferase